MDTPNTYAQWEHNKVRPNCSTSQNARAERRLRELQAEITKLEKEREAAVRRVQRSFLGGLRSAMAT